MGGERIVLEDKYLKDEPFEIDGTWHIYMVGGGDGGFLYFVKKDAVGYLQLMVI